MIEGETYDDLKAELGEKDAPSREDFGALQDACAAGTPLPDLGSGDDHDNHDDDHKDGGHGGEHDDGDHEDDKADHEDDDEGDDEDDDDEFAHWCERIAELPEEATWDDVKDDLAAEFGDDAPAEEEFIAVSWACEAAAHEAIEDFEEVCATIATEVDPETPWSEMEAVLDEKLGEDAPTEDQWTALVWACEAAAEYGDEDGDDEDGDDEDGDDEDGDDEDGDDEDEDSEEFNPSHYEEYCDELEQIPEDMPWADVEAYLLNEHG